MGERVWRAVIAGLLLTYAGLTLLLVLHVVPGKGYAWAPVVLSGLAAAATLLHAAAQMGWRRTLAFFLLTFGISLALETVGVVTGWVYGGYHYTSKLGWRFLGVVPIIIPLAWFMMVYPGWVIARGIVQPRASRGSTRLKDALAIAALGGLILTAWDLLMDPLMVHLGYWIWEEPGAYFGIPVRNFIGWWVTVALIHLLHEIVIRPPKITPRGPAPACWAVLLYGLVGLSNLTAVLAIQNAHLQGPALAGLFAMLPWALWGWKAWRSISS